MAVKVIIPTPLRVYAGKRDSAEFSARTVGEALGHLTTQFADLRKHLFTEDGKLRSFVNVYVNDEDIRYLARENTPTKDGDTISIIPSIAGGNIMECTQCADASGASSFRAKRGISLRISSRSSKLNERNRESQWPQ
jgi:molybdopterin converting factor small subunit